MDNPLSLAPIGDFSCINGRGRPRIKARVISVWNIRFNPDHPSFICQEMILIDRLGSKNQASVCRRHPLMHSIVAGRVYIFSRFRVLPNNDFSFSNNQFRLFFHTCTRCALTYDDRIPRYGWSFINIQEIRAQGENPHRLIDCVGVVSAASDVTLFTMDGRMRKMLIIELQDPSGRIGCVITGNNVVTLADYLAENWTKRPVIVMQHVRITSFRDKVVIETFPVASKLMINIDIDEAHALTMRMSELGLNYNGPVGFIRANEPPKNPMIDFIQNHPRKTISQLMATNQGETCVVHAAIVAVLTDGPWYYPSCRCYAELRANGDKFDCLRCGRTIGKMINRFRFKVEVFDGKNSAVFLLLDREAEALTGFSCEELLNKIQTEKRVIRNGDYPVEIEDRIHGMELLFKVSNKDGVNYDRNDCFHVMRLCDDLDVIAMFHEHDDVETSDEAKSSPRFTESDTSLEDGEDDTVLSGGKRTLAATNEKEVAHNRLRRKLVIDFESDEEDLVGIAGSDVCPPEIPYQQKVMAFDAVGGSERQEFSRPSAAVISIAKSETEATDGVTHQPEPDMAVADIAFKKKELEAVVTVPSADLTSGLHAAVDSKQGTNGLPIFGEGSMGPPPTVDRYKKALSIKVSHAEVAKALDGMADDAHIVDISDDEVDDGA